jgi:hypothetical protein
MDINEARTLFSEPRAGRGNASSEELDTIRAALSSTP